MEWLPFRSNSSSSQPGVLCPLDNSRAVGTTFAFDASDSKQRCAMFRTPSRTTPGRIESLTAACPVAGHPACLVSFSCSAAAAAAASQDQVMPSALPFQSTSHWQQPPQLCSWPAQTTAVQQALLPPIATTQFPAASAANSSFSFQHTPEAAAAAAMDASPSMNPDLEALFDKAEAAVDVYLDSPQAAMLFGNDISDTLSRLCEDPASQHPNSSTGTAATAALAVDASPADAPHTAYTCENVTSPNAAVACREDTDMETAQEDQQRLQLHQDFGQRFSTDSGLGCVTRGFKRWGLDLSDEGSGRAVWRHSTGGSAAAKPHQAAAAAPGALGRNHRFSVSDGCSRPHCTAHKCCSTTCGSIHGTKHKVLKTKPHGSLSPSFKAHGASLNRSSCPGGWMTSSRQVMTSSGGTYTAVLDLSDPDPVIVTGTGGENVTHAGGDSSDVALTGKTAAVACQVSGSSKMAAAACQVSGSSKMAGTKHTASSPIHCLDLSAAANTTNAAVGMSTSEAAALDELQPQQQQRFCAKHRKISDAAVSPRNQNSITPPVAQQNNLSFTSWAVAGTTAAAATATAKQGVTAERGTFCSPFSNRDAVAAALLGTTGDDNVTTAAAVAVAGEDDVTTDLPGFTREEMHKSRIVNWHSPQQQQHNSNSSSPASPPSPGTASAALVAALKAAAITAASCQTPKAVAAASAMPSPLPLLSPQQQQQQQQQQQPLQGSHVGVAITTQSGTGPMTRRVSSQVLVLPGFQGGSYDHIPVQTLDYGSGSGFSCDGRSPHIAAAAAVDESLWQQHLQLPRIRTKSQPNSCYTAAAGMNTFVEQLGYDTSSGSSSGGVTNPHPFAKGSNTAANGSISPSGTISTPGSCQAGFISLSGPPDQSVQINIGLMRSQAGPDTLSAPAAAVTGVQQGTASPSALLNHIAHMTLHNSSSNSPSSCYSSGSGTIGLVTPLAAAAAAGAGVVTGAPCSMHAVQQQQQQHQWHMQEGCTTAPWQQQQQQQCRPSRLSKRGISDDAGLIQLTGHTVTTGLPVAARTAAVDAGQQQWGQQQQQQWGQQQQQQCMPGQMNWLACNAGSKWVMF